MRERLSGSIVMAAAAGAALIVLSAGAPPVQAQTAAAVEHPLMTPWGEPDLQGIWNDETDTSLQRLPQYANQEFFTDAQRRELDEMRAGLSGKDKRSERGTELDVTASYNQLFGSKRHTGARTSRIVDPPNGRLPPLTAAAQQRNGAERSYRLALLQSTETCKIGYITCAGGKYDPTPSPRLADPPPRYNVARMNRHDGPEDGTLADRCLTPGVPQINSNSFRRIVQTPGGVAMFNDVGQGQGGQRNIVMNGSPHLPASIRQWYGDSRGHWEGNTLVIDITNFSPKTDFQGSRENLHVVERYTRTGPKTLQYTATIEDPTVWTRPWTVQQELVLQSNEENKMYYEPRCNEGNYALPGLIRGARMEETAYAAGRGPHPATHDSATSIGTNIDDPLAQ